ncbi:MAG: carboxypeptidase-like regulatory domain-containing protein [Bacilli bacterium]
MKNDLKEIMKNKKVFIAVCVFALTLLTIGVSYSAFFTVKTNKGNQTLTTGTLAVSYSGQTPSINKTDMQMMSDIEALSQGESRIVYVQNTGTLKSFYNLLISYDMTNFLARPDYKATDVLTPIEYIKLAVYDYNSTTKESTMITGPISVADLPIEEINTGDSRYNKYSVLIGNLDIPSSGNATKTYLIKIWLSDKASAAASKTFFYVNSEIVANVKEAEMNYTVNGSLFNAGGTAISGATVSLQNGSIVATTSATGTFSLPTVSPGTYNVDITADNVIYRGNLTVKEGTSVALTSLGTSFTALATSNIYNSAFTYGSTPAKIIAKNNLKEVTSSVTLVAGNIYQLMPSYVLTGGTSATISTMKITLGSDGNIASFAKV